MAPNGTPSGSRSWVVIAAVAASLLAMVIVLKQLRGGGSASSPKEQIAAAARDERGGIANPETGAPADDGGVRAAGHDSGWLARAGAASRHPGEGNAEPAPGVGATGIQGERRVGGSLGRDATSLGPSGAVRVGAAASLPEHGASEGGPPTLPNGARAQRQVSIPPEQALALAGDSSTAQTGDDKGQVLNLFDKSGDQATKGEPIVDQGVTYQSGEGAHFASDAHFEIPNAGNLNGDAGTLAFCLRPEWSGGDGSDASFVQLRNHYVYENRIQITKNGSYLRFIFAPNTGLEHGAGVRIDNWQPGQTHAVATAWGKDPQTGDSFLGLYVDGRLAGQDTYDGTLEMPNVPLMIGSDYPGEQPSARGTMSSFQGYNSNLPSGQIASLAANCSQ